MFNAILELNKQSPRKDVADDNTKILSAASDMQTFTPKIMLQKKFIFLTPISWKKTKKTNSPVT